MAHTPGPWKQNGLQIEARKMALKVATVAPSGTGYAPRNRAEAEANACLIAAAPYLLESVKDAIAPYHNDPNPPHWVAVARVVAGRAEGKI